MKNNWQFVDSRKKRIERIVRKIKKLENKLIGLRQNKLNNLRNKNFKLVW